MHAGKSVESAPLHEVADVHGVTFPGPCLLYNIHIASWTLSPDKLSLPAPPQHAFGALTSGHTGAAGASPVARRLLSDSVNCTLVVNGLEAVSLPVEYVASMGPQLLTVSPKVISAAMPEVCLPSFASCCFVSCYCHRCLAAWLNRGAPRLVPGDAYPMK
jgi:hypothetical protein